METPVYLKSLHIHNFRHRKENPRVIGFVNFIPKGYDNRLCFKVIYESDNLIDHIPYVEIENGVWAFTD
jgi:hypothetical protein